MLVVALGYDNNAFVSFLGIAQEFQRGFTANTDGHHNTGEENVAMEGEQGHVVGDGILVEQEGFIVLGHEGDNLGAGSETVGVVGIEYVYII